MRRAALLVAVAILPAALALGCGSTRVRPGVHYLGTHRSYLQVLANWTRTAERFDGAETDALASATFWSEAFSRAYAQERARAEALPREKAEELERHLLAEHARHNRFRLVFYTVDRAWNDLDKRPSSWKVYLRAADGSLVEPVSIERLSVRPRAEELFFPDTDPWSRTYEIVFPKSGADGTPLLSETSGRFGLLITGARARAELVWRFD